MTVATLTPANTKPRALFVFDFDMSLVNDDCEFFLKQVAHELLAEIKASLTALPTSWPAFADEICGVFAARKPDFTRDELFTTLGSVPVMPGMVDIITRAVDEYQATVMIVSDANQVFIQSMLNHHDLSSYISEIHTNVAYWEQGNRLRVKPYHAETEPPHGCKLCPPNMCKGRILDAIREKGGYALVMYVGDGIGDYCPATRLNRYCTLSIDTIRETYHLTAWICMWSDGKPFALLETIEKNPLTVCACVVPWTSAQEIQDGVIKALGAKD